MVDINPEDIERGSVEWSCCSGYLRITANAMQFKSLQKSKGKPVVSFSTGVIVSKLRKKLMLTRRPQNLRTY
jgi:hypothetical protein